MLIEDPEYLLRRRRVHPLHRLSNSLYLFMRYVGRHPVTAVLGILCFFLTLGMGLFLYAHSFSIS